MADDPNKKKQDAKLTSQQKHELRFLAEKHDLPIPLVKNVVKDKGTSRKAVDKYLGDMKKNGRK